MKRLSFSVFILFSIVLPVFIASADTANTVGQPSANTIGQPSANTVGQPVSSGQTSYSVDNPLGPQGNSVCGLVKALLAAAIQIGIPIAVLFIVYAGFKFILARGSPEKLKEARQNFLWTIIGIAIFLGAWLLASVIANTVNQLGGSQNLISCK